MSKSLPITDRRKYNKGTVGNKGGTGKPSKAQKEKLLSLLDPALNVVREALCNKERWAAELVVNKVISLMASETVQDNSVHIILPESASDWIAPEEKKED